MPPGDSPTVARRRIRLAVRQAREQRGLTQSDVAEAMEWSLSKVIRIESGEVGISPNDLRPLLPYLGIKDRAFIESLMQDAKIARTRQKNIWWQESDYREFLTDPLRHLIEFEQVATAIHYFQIYHVPGPLQIPKYAEALIRKWHAEISEEQIRHRVEARRLRRESLLQRLSSLRVTGLLDESVFMRPIGGVPVFAAQLRELMRLNQENLVSIRMVPFSVDAALSDNAAFDLLYLSEDNDDVNAVLYRETGTKDEIVEDREMTSRHRARYEKLWNAAMNESDTTDFIQERLKSLD